MAKNSKSPTWLREMLAELVGTYLLIMIGDSAVANYLLNRQSKVGVDHFAVAFTFGIAGMLGIAASFPISGAHLNPAVSLAFAVTGRFPYRKLAHYFLGQYLGSFLAAATVFLVYYDGINSFDNGIRVPFLFEGSNNTDATGGIFSTYPAAHVTIAASLIDQVVATFSLVLGALIITGPNAQLPAHLHPFMLGMLICGLVVAFGLNCGAALNPARDLSPRIFQVLAGYGIDAFKPVSWTYWLTGGIVGPHLGGILGAWTFDKVLLYEDEKTSDDQSKTTRNNGTPIKESKQQNNSENMELQNTTTLNDDSSKPFLVVND